MSTSERIEPELEHVSAKRNLNSQVSQSRTSPQSLMTSRDEEHNERVAYHEAGHALVAILLGYEVTKATIEKNESTGAEGETTAVRRDANIVTYLLGQLGIISEEDSEDQIAYLMAGVEAVRLAGCEKRVSVEGSELSDDIVEARSDIFEAMRIAERLARGAGPFRDLKLESGKSNATVLLERNIAALNAIAMALLESKDPFGEGSTQTH